MDIASALILLLVGACIVAWVRSPTTGRALEAFGLGFIGFRSAGWPKGVQEEEPVHYAFHRGARSRCAGRPRCRSTRMSRPSSSTSTPRRDEAIVRLARLH